MHETSYHFCIYPINLTTFSQEVNWSYQMDSAGVLDVVIGAGNENHSIKLGIVAIDGKSGKVLWKYSTRSKIYKSAMFQELQTEFINLHRLYRQTLMEMVGMK